MGILSPTLIVEERKQKAGGGGPPRRPPRGDGGDWGGGRGDGAPNFDDRLRRYRIGMIVGLTPILMLFIAFTSAYIVRQGLGTWDAQSNAYVTDWRSMSLPPILWLNTVILLLSSATLEMARRSLLGRRLVLREISTTSLQERDFPWLAVTLVLGFMFLAGQAIAWNTLQAQGVYMASNPSSSFFYLLTGAHAIHLVGGVIALLVAALTTASSKSLDRKRLVVDVTSWYWHFMALLWVYIFALLHFAK